jgi:high-affinity nickel permease
MEVALLTMAGLVASQALPLSAVLVLPIVFAAGMSLLDSADGATSWYPSVAAWRLGRFEERWSVPTKDC